MRRQSKRILYAIIPSICGIIVVAYLISTNWQLLDSWNYRGQYEFGDLQVLINLLKCKWSSETMTQSQVICPKTVYGTFTDFVLGIPANHNWDVGVMATCVIAIFFISISLLSYYANSGAYTTVLVLALMSPPLILLYERANLDLVIFSLLLFSTLIFFTRLKILSIVFVVLTVLLKFYTFPVLILLMIIEKNKKFKLLIFILALLLASYLVVDVFFSQRSNDFSAASAFGAFGLTSIDQILLQGLGRNFHSAFGILTVCTYLALLIFRGHSDVLKKVFANLKGIDNANSLIFFSFTLLFLELFFLNLNYDYRLVFLIPVVCSNFYRRSRTHVLTFLAFYFSYNLNGVQVFGDFAILGIVFYITLLILTHPEISSAEKRPGVS